MKCFVTGASGHLGSFLVEKLISYGHEVSILVRPRSNLWRLKSIISKLSQISGGIENIHLLEKDILKFDPEVIFNLAWHDVTGNREDPNQFYINLPSQLSLLKIIGKLSQCHSLINIGSQAEYGLYDTIIDEFTTPKPETAYGVAKLATSFFTQKLCEEMKIRHVWLRLFSSYGPKEDSRHLIPVVINTLLKDQKPSLTLGEQVWDYLYIEDTVEAIYQAAIHNSANGIFNLASGKNYQIREVVEKIRNLINPKLSIGFGDIPYSEKQVMSLKADISKITSTIKWNPSTNLDIGLSKTVDWYKKTFHGIGK